MGIAYHALLQGIHQNQIDGDTPFPLVQESIVTFTFANVYRASRLDGLDATERRCWICSALHSLFCLSN
jgi:hypothetical protein